MKYLLFSLMLLLSACDSSIHANVSSEESSRSFNYSSSNQIEVKKLSGVLSKLVIDNKNLNQLSSTINVIQNCSNSEESFLLIDSALVDFVDIDELNFGKIKINANYYLKDETPVVYINTPSLSFFTSNSNADINLNCLSKNSTVKNLGSGNVIIDSKDLDFISLINGSSGNIELNYSRVSSVYNFGSGDIVISNQVKVTKTKNTGSGAIKLL